MVQTASLHMLEHVLFVLKTLAAKSMHVIYTY